MGAENNDPIPAPMADVFGRMQKNFDKVTSKAYDLLPAADKSNELQEFDLEAGHVPSSSSNAHPSSSSHDPNSPVHSEEGGLPSPIVKWNPSWKNFANFSKKAGKVGKVFSHEAQKRAKVMQGEATKHLEKAKENYNNFDTSHLNQKIGGVFEKDKLLTIGNSIGSSATAASAAATAATVAAQNKLRAAMEDGGALSGAASGAASAAKNAAGAASKAATITKDKAATAASASTAKIGSAAKSAGKKLGDVKGSMEALTMSREKMMTFLMVFVTGFFICSIAFTYIPLIVIFPQKFALLFALGSGLMMGSFGVVKGFKEFAAHCALKEKRPFSAAYVIGMIGVLWASLFHPWFAYLWIIFFSSLQVIGLTYFLVSYIPGGRAALNFVGRSCLKLCKSCRK